MHNPQFTKGDQIILSWSGSKERKEWTVDVVSPSNGCYWLKGERSGRKARMMLRFNRERFYRKTN
jgi:hypothetical protein